MARPVLYSTMACSLVSIAFTSLARADHLLGIFADDFIENTAGVCGFTEDTSGPLFGLSGGGLPTDHDGDLGFGDIDAFIKDAKDRQLRLYFPEELE